MKHCVLPAVALASLAVTGCALFDGPGRPDNKPPAPVRLDLFVAVSEPAEGYGYAQDEHGRSLYITPGAFLTDAEVWSAAVYSGRHGSVLRLDFTHYGAVRLEGVTRQNIGRRMAVYVDGHPVMSPEIVEPIVSGRLLIDGGFSKSRAEALARSLNAQSAARSPGFHGTPQ